MDHIPTCQGCSLLFKLCNVWSKSDFWHWFYIRECYNLPWAISSKHVAEFGYTLQCRDISWWLYFWKVIVWSWCITLTRWPWTMTSCSGFILPSIMRKNFNFSEFAARWVLIRIGCRHLRCYFYEYMTMSWETEIFMHWKLAHYNISYFTKIDCIFVICMN